MCYSDKFSCQRIEGSQVRDAFCDCVSYNRLPRINVELRLFPHLDIQSRESARNSSPG